MCFLFVFSVRRVLLDFFSVLCLFRIVGLSVSYVLFTSVVCCVLLVCAIVYYFVCVFACYACVLVGFV